MSFKRNLNNILIELQEHHGNKSEVLAKCIQQRLDKSISTNYSDLSKSVDYLASKNSMKVVKKL